MFEVSTIRFRSGQTCRRPGHYRFDRYCADDSWEPLPVGTEQAVYLQEGDSFPRIESSDRDCYWVRADD